MNSLDVLMMRHGYDDHSYIDGKNDTPLTQEGIEIAQNESKKIVSLLNRYQNTIDIHVSSKKRALETAEILTARMDKSGPSYNVTINDQLRELYQGEMLNLGLRTHQEKVRMLELGWEIFDRERVTGNDDYKFGTPDLSDDKYNEFNKFIAHPYGESQNDLARRIEHALCDILESSVPKGDTPLVIAHRGTIREILNITHAHNNRISNTEQNPHIEMAGWRYCELFTASLFDVNFSLGALRKSVSHGA